MSVVLGVFFCATSFLLRMVYKKIKLKSSKSLQTSAKAMLFARWQHHIWFGSGFLYAPLKAMSMKISK